MNLQDFKKEFDIHLKIILDKKIEQISSYTKNPNIIDYINHANQIALVGGKRIRPFIAYLFYLAFGGKKQGRVIKILVALEIFHLFALIHDDIMDKDQLRHGIPTSQVYIANELRKKGDKDFVHLGLSQAILVGDLFFNWAWEIVGQEKSINKLFSEMVDGTAVGQMLDVESKNKPLDQTLIYEINYLKTARYSFIYPLLIGASLAKELNSEEIKFLNDIGLNLGMAFQAQDDIFDSDNKEYIESQKQLIENNLEKARILIKKSRINEAHKKKFFEFINLLEKRKF